MANSARISEIERPGVLNELQIKRLIKSGVIKNRIQSKTKDIGESSFDLHIGKRFWKLGAGFKCQVDRRVGDLIREASRSNLVEKTGSIPEKGIPIDKGETFLFELQEEIELKEGFYGQGTGRSSIGRLDVLTRLLVDEEEKYDWVEPGKRKRLYVEVTPLSFPIKLGLGCRIYQLRVSKGEFKKLQIEDDLVKLHALFMKREDGSKIEGTEQCHLRLNLTPTRCKGINEPVIAFRAKSDARKPRRLNLCAKEGKYIPEYYWEAITKTSSEVREFGEKLALRVQKDKFYILRSQERLNLPLNVAVYAIAMTEEVGELRIHHAGFVHPGFGSKRKDHKGTPLIFEVRGHDVNMLLMDGDLMAEIHYYPMSEPVPPKKKEKSKKPKRIRQDVYEMQELKLSSIFKEFGHAH